MPDTPFNAAAAISVSAMARRVGLSRARFYELMQAGFFAAPVCLLGNKRSVYLASMVERNLLAKQTGIGCNGEIRVFNESVSRTTSVNEPGNRNSLNQRTRSSHNARASRRSSQTNGSDGLVQRLVHAQRQLGLTDVTTEQVSEAIARVCPHGTGDIAEADLIRGVYRRLREASDA